MRKEQNSVEQQAEEIFEIIIEEVDEDSVSNIPNDETFIKQHEDFYIKMRKQIKSWLKSKNGKDNKWADYVLLAPDLFHLMLQLVIDPDVPVGEKVRLVSVLGYFVLPFELMPEGFLGPIGYLDDVALAAYILNRLVNVVDPQIIYKHWTGDESLIQVLQQILKVADQMISKGIWNVLKGHAGPKV